MERTVNLLLALPAGMAIATSLGLSGFAWHRSPGSARHFRGRSVLVDLPIENDGPGFSYFDEGGWRDAAEDTRNAIAAAHSGKRTKTALSNNAFSIVPLSAYQRVCIAKTEGQLLELQPAQELTRYLDNPCQEHSTPDEVARLAGLGRPAERVPRIYLVLSPIELLVMSNLTPEEYGWYATHRPGKVFRQVMFAELRTDHGPVAAQVVYDEALEELHRDSTKKTKTLVGGDLFNHIPFRAWTGYRELAEGLGPGAEKETTVGGIYVGDRHSLNLWRFPERIPQSWDRAV